MGDDFMEQLRGALEAAEPLAEGIRRAVALIQSRRSYRWVGLFQVEPSRIAAMAWTGSTPPAFPSFPITQGLCGQAVQSRATVVVGDVRNDPHYLTTFGSTRSEIVIPVRRGDAIVGLIDVDSEQVNAFGTDDRAFLERCAGLLAEYWPGS